MNGGFSRFLRKFFCERYKQPFNGNPPLFDALRGNLFQENRLPPFCLKIRLTIFAEKKIKVLCIFSGKRKSREQGANFDFKQFVTIRYETRDARRTSCYTRNEQNIVSAIKNAKLNAENIARYFPADSG